jgi:heptosyltransferase-2
MMAPVERILVKDVNWLGDVIMSLPALRAVRRAFPQARLSVLIKKELASLLDGAAWLDEIIPYSVSGGLAGLADRRRIIAGIRARRFDLALLFPKSFESALWVRLAGVPRRAGFADDGRSPLLTDRAVLHPECLRKHQVHDYLHMIHETLGIEGSADDYGLEIAEAPRERMRDWLARRRRRPQQPLIALAPAAAYGPAKEWPLARFGALIDLLAERHGAECVLVGAPGEKQRCEVVASASRRGALVAAGETSTGELAALLSLCSGFAGNDSGSMHVAGAIGIPTVGIFGSTNPDRTGPLGARTRVVYRRVECSPCFDRTCRFGHYECLKRISVEEVAGALGELGGVTTCK